MSRGPSTTGRNYAVALASAAVTGLAFLYPTSTNHGSVTSPTTVPAPVGVIGGTSGSASGSTQSTSPVTVNGPAVDTRYGPVQVQISVVAGRVVSATAIVYPQSSGRDQEINAYAVPVLQDEAVAAQSAQIDTVSGATYTSDGYRTSLQAALDSAHVG